MVVGRTMLASLTFQMSPMERAETQSLGARSLRESWWGRTRLGAHP